MIRYCLIAMMALVPVSAKAGPWPREVGQTFASVSVERNRAGNRYTSVYSEYGLSPRTTLGVEIGQADQDETSAVIWLQRSLDDGQGPHRLSMSAGVGAIRREGHNLPVVQSAVNWGRGFEGWGDDGWMSAQLLIKMTGSQPPVQGGEAVEPSFAARFLTAETALKSDLTLGLRPMEGVMVINSLWLEDRAGSEFTAKLASTMIIATPGPMQIELGVVNPIHGTTERAIRLGSWIEF